MELETKRLLLRQWRESDREPFAKMNADPKVMEYFPGLLDRAASDALMDRYRSEIAERGWGFWALERRGTGAFLGFVGLNVPREDLPISPCVEIAWRLDAQRWGNGFATEAGQACLRAAFEGLAIDELVSFTSCGNLPSQAVMGRLQMHQTAETFLHPSLPIDSPLAAHCVYRLDRRRWQAQGAQVRR